jgi:di/tripeptidase
MEVAVLLQFSKMVEMPMMSGREAEISPWQASWWKMRVQIY